MKTSLQIFLLNMKLPFRIESLFIITVGLKAVRAIVHIALFKGPALNFWKRFGGFIERWKAPCSTTTELVSDRLVV